MRGTDKINICFNYVFWVPLVRCCIYIRGTLATWERLWDLLILQQVSGGTQTGIHGYATAVLLTGQDVQRALRGASQSHLWGGWRVGGTEEGMAGQVLGLGLAGGVRG